MIKDVKEFVNIYSAIDAPIPYEGLLIYPITVRQYYEFGTSYDILDIDKNQIADIEIIQMPYLDFLYKRKFVEEEIIDKKNNITVGMYNLAKFLNTLKMCLKVEDENNINCYIKNNHSFLSINNIELDASQFNELRRIILYQNVHDYSDDYIDPDMKKSIDEYYRIKNKGISIPDLEDEIAAFTAMTGICKKEVLDMTYREYKKVFDASLDKLDYQIYKSAELSGMIEFEKPVDHWVYKPIKNKYEDAFVSADKVKEKIASVN